MSDSSTANCKIDFKINGQTNRAEVQSVKLRHDTGNSVSLLSLGGGAAFQVVVFAESAVITCWSYSTWRIEGMLCCLVIVASLLFLPGYLAQDTDGLSLELASVVNSVQSH